MFGHHTRVVVIVTLMVSSTSGYGVARDKYMQPTVSSIELELRSDYRQSWVSAIGNDRTDQLVTLINTYDPTLLLPLTASNGKTALMVASKKGDLALASKLVDAGADIHEKTQTSGTAFMFAILGNIGELARWLVMRGADINIVGSNGWTALTIAAAKGNAELLSWLIDLGADAQVRDVYRFTPLLRAVDNGYEKAAALLLSLPETDVNARDEYDNTALHHAVSAGNIDMINLLMKHNADVHLANREGVSPLAMSQDISVLEALLNPEFLKSPQDPQ